MIKQRDQTKQWMEHASVKCLTSWKYITALHPHSIKYIFWHMIIGIRPRTAHRAAVNKSSQPCTVLREVWCDFRSSGRWTLSGSRYISKRQLSIKCNYQRVTERLKAQLFCYYQWLPMLLDVYITIVPAFSLSCNLRYSYTRTQRYSGRRTLNDFHVFSWWQSLNSSQRRALNGVVLNSARGSLSCHPSWSFVTLGTIITVVFKICDNRLHSMFWEKLFKERWMMHCVFERAYW